MSDREYFSNIKGRHSYIHSRISSNELPLSLTYPVQLVCALDAETVFTHFEDIDAGGYLVHDSSLASTKAESIPSIEPDLKERLRDTFSKIGIEDTISSLTQYLEGAKKVKVFDRTVHDARRCYHQSGIAEAATGAGAEVSFIDDRKFKTVTLPGLALKDWPLYTEILEADKVINVPIAKTHGLATLTMALKNWMGIMGGGRGRIHQRLDECLADVATAIKPTLTVLDAIRILTDNGPQGGNLKDVKQLNTIIVSTDQVAVDAYGATLFGLQGGDLGYVRTAHRIGLGTMDLSKVTIKTITC